VNAVSDLLSDIAAAVRATAAVTLIAGVLVLAGAMAAGHRRRVYDAVILKVLGATRNDVLKAYIVEYAILGFVAALIATIAGTIASYAVIEVLMGATWHFLPLATGGTAVAGVVLTVLLGLTGTWTTLGARPAPILRTA
jgi:putative ABC transport system permease protein